MRPNILLLTRIAISLVLATATVVAVSMHSRADATPETCATSHANVDGYDAGPFGAFGNKGYIYINTKTTLDSINATIWRSFFVSSDAYDEVEFGWTDVPNSVPTPAADWYIDGQPSAVHTFNYDLTYDTDVRFRIENLGTQNIFRFVIAGQSSPIGYSAALPFGSGFEMTNSEHYNSCDSMWTHMQDLAYELPVGVWNSGYQNLEHECAAPFNTKGDGWLFDKSSNSELYVSQTSGTSC